MSGSSRSSISCRVAFAALISSGAAWAGPQSPIVRVNVNALGVQANNNSFEYSINGDGRFVAFTSVATNLVTNDSNGNISDVFVKDLQSQIDSL